MSEETAPLSNSVRSALGDAAQRLDLVAKEVRAQQVASVQSPGTFGAQPKSSPDEEWSKKFMTQSIGPEADLPHLSALAAAPPLPDVSLDFTPRPAAPPAPAVYAPPPPEAFGAPLGVGPARKAPPVRPSAAPDLQHQEPPRRSWLGRLFRGSV